MPLIDVDDVQSWLELTKLNLDHSDELPEEPFWSEYVMSRLASVNIDSSAWIDTSTTPTMVKAIIGMLVAAQRYNKVYSESEDGGNPYADKLEARAMMLIDGIIAGTIEVVDIISEELLTHGQPVFYPTDSTGLIDDTEDQVRFTMGMRF